MMNGNTTVIGFIIVLLIIFYNLKIDNGLSHNDTASVKIRNTTMA